MCVTVLRHVLLGLLSSSVTQLPLNLRSYSTSCVLLLFLMLANVYEYLWHVIYHTLSFEIKADSTFLHYEDLYMEITIEERSVIDK